MAAAPPRHCFILHVYVFIDWVTISAGRDGGVWSESTEYVLRKYNYMLGGCGCVRICT
jgi:hypothetical protein